MIELIASNSLVRTAILIVLFAMVVGLVMTVLQMLARRSAVRGELQSLSASTGNRGGADTLRGRRDDAWTKLADRIERAGLDLTDTKSDALRGRLVAAGYESQAAPRIYTLIRLFCVIVFPCLLVGASLIGGSELSVLQLYIFGSVSAIFGLYLPVMFISAKADRRRETILHGFPDSLDLMLVCVEAGLGLEAALDRVGREMAISQPLVSNILTTATLQLRAGASRETALRRMAETTNVDEISSFATLLIQSDKLGSSIATTLRIYSDEMREKRRMRAEEKAHRIPVLISIPLVACLLPVMIGVLILPAAVRVVREMLPAMQGG